MGHRDVSNEGHFHIFIFYHVQSMEYVNMMHVPNHSAEAILAIFQMGKCEDVPYHKSPLPKFFFSLSPMNE
jgi:hypothetical protein